MICCHKGNLNGGSEAIMMEWTGARASLLLPPMRRGKALEDYFLGWAWAVLFLLLTGSFDGGGPFWVV